MGLWKSSKLARTAIRRSLHRMVRCVGIATSQIFRLVVTLRARSTLVEEISYGGREPQQRTSEKQVDTGGQQIKLEGTVPRMVRASIDTVSDADELNCVDKLPGAKTAKDQNEYLSWRHRKVLTNNQSMLPSHLANVALQS